jgi:oligoendopeptidase F
VEGGGALTPEALSNAYGEICQRYYGPEVNIGEFTPIEWARIPHFYRAFYVYQYATGMSAAAALSRMILEDGEPARKRYIEFLSSGSSGYSLDLLRDAGVDMTTPEPIEQALDVFESLLNKLEDLIDASPR